MSLNKKIYLTSTVLLSLLIVMGATMYFVNYDEVSKVFLRLGYPVHIVYPLAVVKILGLIAIWCKKSQTLKEFAYAGFIFDFILAIGAHLSVNDGEFIAALVALILVVTSYVTEKKVYG